MNKFVLLSFGFLAWAFYEMSGGDEFEPASERLARLNPQTEAPADEAETAAFEPKTIDTTPALVPLTPEVTRVALNLATLDDILGGEEDTAPTAASEPETSDEEDPYGVPRNVAVVTDSGTTPAIIPSLITGNQEVQAVASAPDTAPQALDIRTVTGNRVNVRGGPGTDFGVVGRLVRGDEVEILEDDGIGWVRMRSIETGEEGWMADFLLNSG
ncbi:MAG: SH3 domain-containing protein [Sulfitobacter sp.]|nr:SH3 domain-containing protein [Sulfitobacter sp.]